MLFKAKELYFLINKNNTKKTETLDKCIEEIESKLTTTSIASSTNISLTTARELKI